MRNNELVRCVKAGIDDYCGICEHGEPHEPDEDCILHTKCTAWGECDLEDSGIIKVRCVKIKEEK